jgi:hypothetical protein
MSVVHFILQKKGGAGKSLISSFWIQYLLNKGIDVIAIDTDPSNKSLTDFKELGITPIELLDENQEINSRKFDDIMELIFESKINEHIVIDTGSSCYVSLLSYLKNNNALEIIKENDNQVYIHVPITGGSDIIHTTQCLGELISSFPDIPFVIWKNRFHGELIVEGKKFEEFKVYKSNISHINSVIEIPFKNAATFGKDLEHLMTLKLTFNSAFKSKLPIMVKQRLKMFWNELTDAMDMLNIIYENKGQSVNLLKSETTEEMQKQEEN